MLNAAKEAYLDLTPIAAFSSCVDYHSFPLCCLSPKALLLRMPAGVCSKGNLAAALYKSSMWGRHEVLHMQQPDRPFNPKSYFVTRYSRTLLGKLGLRRYAWRRSPEPESPAAIQIDGVVCRDTSNSPIRPVWVPAYSA